MKEIEDFLRENKPTVKNDPTFILETMHRMDQVEGIKAEVDRQRKNGRKALILALAAGLVIGSVATAIAFLYPVDSTTVSHGVWESTRQFLTAYRLYLSVGVAVLAISLYTLVWYGWKPMAR